MQWESPFHTNTVTDLPNSISSADTSTVTLDNNPFKHLDTFTGTFNDPRVNPHSITGTEFWNIIAQLTSSNLFD